MDVSSVGVSASGACSNSAVMPFGIVESWGRAGPDGLGQCSFAQEKTPSRLVSAAKSPKEATIFGVTSAKHFKFVRQRPDLSNRQSRAGFEHESIALGKQKTLWRQALSARHLMASAPHLLRTHLSSILQSQMHARVARLVRSVSSSSASLPQVWTTGAKHLAASEHLVSPRHSQVPAMQGAREPRAEPSPCTKLSPSTFRTGWRHFAATHKLVSIQLGSWLHTSKDWLYFLIKGKRRTPFV